MDFQNHYFTEEAKIFAEQVLKEYQDEFAQELSPEFISRLVNHLEKMFPAYGDFDQQIGNEIRKYMSGEDNKKVKNMKKRLHDIILKLKVKFLVGVQNKAERLKVVPRQKMEPHNINVTVPPPSTGALNQ